MKTKTNFYVSPEVSVTEIQAEGILCASGDFSGNGFELYEEDETWS